MNNPLIYSSAQPMGARFCIKHYFIPTLVTFIMLGGLALFCTKIWPYLNLTPVKDGEIISLPHGRVMYVVVEEEGVYIGDKIFQFSEFEAAIGPWGQIFRPDYFVVLGTDKARYGHFADVYAAIKGTLKIPGTIETRSVEVGTRRPAITQHKYFWQY